jgi:hypothetical protein
MEKHDKVAKTLRNSVAFGTRTNNQINTVNEDIRKRSATLANPLLTKFIPKLKPIDTELCPSPINLVTNEDKKVDDNFILEKNKKSSKKLSVQFNKIQEELYENINSSGDEKFNEDEFPIYSQLSDNESKSDQIMEEKKKNINNDKNNINTIRKKMKKIRSEIKLNKFNDDSIISDNSNRKNFEEDFISRHTRNYKSNLQIEKIKESLHYRNKSISFKDMPRFRPPILGFLEMNETIETTISSNNLSKYD